MLTMLADERLHGHRPFGFHLTVWLLHGACALALYGLAVRLLAPPAAALGASLFAASPLHAEAVGWIAGRSDVLATLFGAVAVALALGGARRDENGGGAGRGAAAPRIHDESAGRRISNRKGALRLAGSGLAFLAALLAKELAIAIGPVLFVAALCRRGDGSEAGRRSRAGRIARAGAAASLPVLIYLAMRLLLDPQASAEEAQGPPMPPLTAAFWSAVYFLRRLVVPFSGAPYRAAPPVSAEGAVLAIVLVSAGVLAAVREVRRREEGRALFLLWVGSALAAASAAAAWGLSRTPVADRYLYLPAAGFSLALASVLAGRGASRRGTLNIATTAAGWVLVAVFAAASWARSSIYADDRAFWTAALAADPSLGAAELNLGNALARADDYPGAVEAYRRALALDLSDADRPLATSDLGAALYGMGRTEEAEPLLRSAARMPSADATAQFNLGAFLYQLAMAEVRHGNRTNARPVFAEAEAALVRAVSLDRWHAKAWLVLGHSRAAQGEIARAREAWSRALEIDGADGEAGREASAALARTSSR